MGKPKKIQNRPKTSQPMPSARTNTVTLSRNRTMNQPPEDDEDICPVCEGECACSNVVESVTASNFTEFNKKQQARSSAAISSRASTSSSTATSTNANAATDSNPTKFPSALPAGSGPSSSKGPIRPLPSYATAAASPSPTPSHIAPRLQSLTLRLATPAKNVDDASDSSASTVDAPHNISSGPQLARFPLSKNVRNSGSGSVTPRKSLDRALKPVPLKTVAKSKGKSKIPTERKPLPTTKKSGTGNPKRPTTTVNKDRKLGRPHKKRVREATSESGLSDFDNFDEDDFVPYPGPQKKQPLKKQDGDGFATFVGTSVFGGSESGSGLDSETSGLELSDDSEIEAEEEQLIVAEAEEEQRRRKLRELLMNSNRKERTEGGRGGEGGRQWEIKPRRKSVEGEQSDDADTSSGSGGESEDEDEDDEDEDEADEEVQAAAWSTDGSDEDLFFANLSDSSTSFSLDQDDDSETVSSAADLAEAANAGFLSGMGIGMPMVVMEDFGAGLGLEIGLDNVLDATDLDFEFERRAQAQLAEEKRSPRYPPADVFSVEYDYTKEAIDAIDGLEMDVDEEAMNATEYEEDSDMDGDTTADEMEHGHTPSRLRFPTPPAINPLATFTPSPATSPIGWRDFTPTHFRPDPFARAIPHTRAASFDGLTTLGIVRGRTISAGTTGAPSVLTDGSMSASEPGLRPPLMGTFGRTGDRKRAAVIDGNATVPSPFTARRRRSNSWKSGRKHFGNKSDIFPMLPRRARQNSIATTTSGRSSFHWPTTEAEMDVDMESCTEPFELDDVLDFSNVSDDNAHTNLLVQEQGTDAQSEAHLRSLDRWDRVPMGTFRHTRETHGASVVPHAGSSDGFSYGAASRETWEGGVLWGGGLGTLSEDKALLPSVSEDSFGNATQNSAEFEKAMSRKERRKRKKLEAACAVHTPTKSFITPPPLRKN